MSREALQSSDVAVTSTSVRRSAITDNSACAPTHSAHTPECQRTPVPSSARAAHAQQRSRPAAAPRIGKAQPLQPGAEPAKVAAAPPEQSGISQRCVPSLARRLSGCASATPPRLLLSP